jgi:hypothetical protein
MDVNKDGVIKVDDLKGLSISTEKLKLLQILWPSSYIFYSVVCQWLATGRWFSPGPPVSSTKKTDLRDITEILLKLALNTIKQTIYSVLIPPRYNWNIVESGVKHL